MQMIKLVMAMAIIPTFAHAEGLSEEARQALIKRIGEIGNQSESMVSQKCATAMKTYASAVASENSAFEFYLKCEEKLNFEDKMKKSSEFRDWKKKNDEKFSDVGFRKALQFQLQWLYLTLKAREKNADKDKLSLEVANYVERLVANAGVLAAHKSILTEDVTSSAFAQIYRINGIASKDWPLSPGKLDAMYEQIILPPLRRRDRIDALKSAWTNRISQEGDLAVKWSPNYSKDAQSSIQIAQQNFMTENLPVLRWNAEVDFYEAGDEVASATRMIKHIEDNITHKSVPQWMEKLREMVGSGTTKEPALQAEPVKPD